MKRLKHIGIIIGLTLVGILVYLPTQSPSHDRAWAADQQVLPTVTMEGNTVHISHARDFTYTSVESFTPRYYHITLNLEDLATVDYLVEPFGRFDGPAHTLLSFGFDTPDGMEYVSVSVEIRKEKGEEFSAMKGLLRQFELMYVIGSERDLIGLRTNFREDDVYLYPIKTTKEKMKQLFVSVADRVNKIQETPEFYNTITNNCTSNIRDHVNDITEGRIPWSPEVILPADSDEYALALGLIDTELSLVDARKKFYITDIAKEAPLDASFSAAIRSGR